MDPERQRQIASKGGQSVPPEERSFSKDPALAASAGRKGGQASHGARASMNASAGSGGTGASSGGHGTQGSNDSESGGAVSGGGRGGNFAGDRAKAAAAGRKGGQRSHGSQHGQH